ncbi:MAG: Hsp20/alpha crystallin family protein [Thermodesulfobacteriota bacterium]
MPALTLWKNKQLHRMKQDIDRMFCDLYRQFGTIDPVHLRQEPLFPEIEETEERLTVSFDLAGLDPERIDILADETSLRLEVSGSETRFDQGRQINGRQAFSGRLQLPCRVMPESAVATVSNGILRIDLPKCRPGGLQRIRVQRS